jgi:hypothetical protein
MCQVHLMNLIQCQTKQYSLPCILLDICSVHHILHVSLHFWQSKISPYHLTIIMKCTMKQITKQVVLIQATAYTSRLLVNTWYTHIMIVYCTTKYTIVFPTWILPYWKHYTILYYTILYYTILLKP